MRLFHGWIVVGAVHVVLFVIFGVAYSFAAFFNSFQQEFGASRGDVSVVFSICSFLYFLVGLFAGQIADRIGPRPVAIVGMAMLAVGLALAARAPSLAGLYVAYGVGVGLGVGCAYVPSIGAVLPWFVRRRGMASGIAAAGIGMGTLLIPPVTSALIATIALLSVDYLRRWLAVIPFLTRWLEKPGIRRFAESFKSYRGPALYRALAVSFVFNLQLVLVNYCLGLALHINLPFVYYLLFVPIVSFVLSLPISWGGLGARETAYVLLFTSVGVLSDQALALSLAFYAVNLLTGAVGGVLYLMSGIRGAREDAAAADGPTTKQV